MTRKEQRARTHERLLDATIHSLVTYGYAGTTTQKIQDGAGVSRGALLHHFSSKQELLVAAIHHIADLRVREFSEQVAGLDGSPEALPQMVAAFTSVMSGPPFQAGIELWSASRTDTELRDALLPAERKLGLTMRERFNEHSGIEDPEAAKIAFESLMALLRGLELTSIMRPDQTIADRVVGEWLASVQRLRSNPHA